MSAEYEKDYQLGKAKAELEYERLTYKRDLALLEYDNAELKRTNVKILSLSRNIASTNCRLSDALTKRNGEGVLGSLIEEKRILSEHLNELAVDFRKRSEDHRGLYEENVVLKELNRANQAKLDQLKEELREAKCGKCDNSNPYVSQIKLLLEDKRVMVEDSTRAKAEIEWLRTQLQIYEERYRNIYQTIQKGGYITFRNIQLAPPTGLAGGDDGMNESMVPNDSESESMERGPKSMLQVSKSQRRQNLLEDARESESGSWSSGQDREEHSEEESYEMEGTNEEEEEDTGEEAAFSHIDTNSYSYDNSYSGESSSQDIHDKLSNKTKNNRGVDTTEARCLHSFPKAKELHDLSETFAAMLKMMGDTLANKTFRSLKKALSNLTSEYEEREAELSQKKSKLKSLKDIIHRQECIIEAQNIEMENILRRSKGEMEMQLDADTELQIRCASLEDYVCSVEKELRTANNVFETHTSIERSLQVAANALKLSKERSRLLAKISAAVDKTGNKERSVSPPASIRQQDQLESKSPSNGAQGEIGQHEKVETSDKDEMNNNNNNDSEDICESVELQKSHSLETIKSKSRGTPNTKTNTENDHDFNSVLDLIKEIVDERDDGDQESVSSAVPSPLENAPLVVKQGGEKNSGDNKANTKDKAEEMAGDGPKHSQTSEIEDDANTSDEDYSTSTEEDKITQITNGILTAMKNIVGTKNLMRPLNVEAQLKAVEEDKRRLNQILEGNKVGAEELKINDLSDSCEMINLVAPERGLVVRERGIVYVYPDSSGSIVLSKLGRKQMNNGIRMDGLSDGLESFKNGELPTIRFMDDGFWDDVKSGTAIALASCQVKNEEGDSLSPITSEYSS